MIMPVEKIPAPRTLEDRRRSRAAWRTAEKASVSFLTEKGRGLYALVRRRWFPAVGRFCANALDVTLEKLFSERVYTYKKGEGYPRVEIRGNGVISVPLEELYRSTKARENLESMRKKMREAMIRQVEREEAEREEEEREARRRRQVKPRIAAVPPHHKKRPP